MNLRGIFIMMAAGLTALHAGSRPPSADLATPPSLSRWPADSAWREMQGRWYRGGSVTAVVDASTPEEFEAYRKDLMGRGEEPPGAPARVIPARTATAGDLKGPLLLVGAAGSSIVTALGRTPIATMLPLRPDEAVRVMSVNPWDPEAAMMIVSGPDDGAVRGLVGESARGWGMRGIEFEFLRAGMRVCYGRFAPSAGGAWSVDAASSVDLRGLVAQERADGVTATYARGELSAGQVKQAMDDARAALREFVRRLGGEPEKAALSLNLYPDRETKAVRTGDPRWSHFDGDGGSPGRLHVVIPCSEPEAGDRIALARAAMASALGRVEPKGLADGIAVWLSGTMMGRPLDWWRERLDRSGLRLGPDDLFDEGGYGRRTYLIGMPSAGIMVRAMLDGLAPSQVQALLRDGARARRIASSIPPRDPVPSTRSGPERPLGVGAFQKGMSLSHEGYAVVDGYGSRAAADQMRQLAAMGVNWIGLSPYGFMRDPALPEVSFLRDEAQSAGTENDVALLSSLRSAHGMGLKVMLKPQLWLPRGHWTGDIAMTTPDAWLRFFSGYRDFLAHYALLAEAGGADLLVVGVEMSGTTRRQSDWRATIAVARALYDGPLTYAANWGEEFEQVEFWDALDHVGLDCYYPLATGVQEDDRPLMEGAREVVRRVERVARRSGRSVILTEVGFPALAQAWSAPHDENTGAARETGAQARCYRAVLAAFWDQPWLAGVFWWKWPTTPPGARREPLFSPRGNPAERVIAEWYSKGHPPASNWPAASSN